MFVQPKNMIFLKVLLIAELFIVLFSANSQVIVDHTCTDITKIPQSAIIQAKSQLHIAYGHTSHGSQITDGMTGLVEFANNGGKGLSLPADIFAWDNGGAGGALDLHDYAMDGDCGYYPEWVNNTVSYLDDPSHSDVNVVIWSWCGQVEDKYRNGTLESEYLYPMNQLEIDYPDVTFVYMTGHVDHWDDADNKAANQQIRNYCHDNRKVLYDFADIESYDPDGTYYEFAHDNCDYYESVEGEKLGNWAMEWQNSHTQGVVWYDCGAAHSYPLNANQKAYAAWWLWAVLGGWNETTEVQEIESSVPVHDYKIHQNYPNPFNSATTISYYLPEKTNVNIEIFNVKGQSVYKLVDSNQPQGRYFLTWQGIDNRGQKVNSGIYFYIFKVINRKIVKKMTLLE
ncbi:MAG: T9SS type A sorting domain-containing protein [bacterium]